MPAGVTNNPKGRPPKNRALTEILEKAGAASLEINGSKVSGKRLLAALLWEAATTGKVTFAEDRVFFCDIDQWAGIAKFIYTHVDGQPKQNVELTGSNGGPIQTQVFDHGNVTAAIAARSSDYSVSPGEDQDHLVR